MYLHEFNDLSLLLVKHRRRRRRRLLVVVDGELGHCDDRGWRPVVQDEGPERRDVEERLDHSREPARLTNVLQTHGPLEEGYYEY